MVTHACLKVDVSADVFEQWLVKKLHWMKAGCTYLPALLNLR